MVAIRTVLINTGGFRNREVVVEGHESLQGECENDADDLGVVQQYLQYYNARERWKKKDADENVT